MDLESLRKEIDAVNNDILHLLKKRFLITDKINAYKNENGLERFDPIREKQQLSIIKEKTDINPSFIEDLFQMIFDESKARKEKISFFQKESFIRKISFFSKNFVIICDNRTKKLYGNSLVDLLKQNSFKVHLFSFPGGEKSKTRKTKKYLENQMLKKKIDKSFSVIALGGGVVTDLAGYLTSTYLRGLPLILLPTTLLSMADASIGGKTAINTPLGKNLLGTFYPPKATFINPKFLQTLDKKEMLNGLAEILKIAVTSSKKLFELIEKNPQFRKNSSSEYFLKVLTKAIELKKSIVKKDPKEKNDRKILNFGHTVGHALETALHYKIPHGRAVSYGILIESYLSVKMGFLKEEEFLKIEKTLKNIGFTFPLLKIKKEKIRKALFYDKKSFRKPLFILPHAIGKAEKCYEVPEKHLQSALSAFLCKK